MKPSEWLKAQPTFLGVQGKTAFDPRFVIDDGGLPTAKPLLQRKYRVEPIRRIAIFVIGSYLPPLTLRSSNESHDSLDDMKRKSWPTGEQFAQ